MNRLLKRRRFVVHRKLQITLAIMSFSYVILFCVVMGAYLFIPLMMELDNSDPGSARAILATNRILYLHEKFWPALLLSLLAIGCHSIIISHKIAGPLYRFDLIFKAIKEGIVPAPTRLRRGDYLHSEMENINQMLEGLRNKLTDLQNIQAHLNRSMMKCKDAARHASINEFIKEMEGLVEEGKKLEEKLGYFKLIS